MELLKCTQNLKLACQFIADLQRGGTYNSQLIRSCMSYLFGGQLSTDNFFFTICVHFQSSVSCLDWNWFWYHFRFGLELIIIPAKTGNITKKMYTNCKIDLVDSWPQMKNMPLLTNQELQVFFLWRSAVINSNSSPNRKWNYQHMA